ncbi:hypothetical protein BO94DRAFT_332861 [Aspergillus sclerotioniger CBS 115572]|uniref:Uncharacterized protein n=1 Tax=Aspergillus sclerotioniger CBS 115572 TaxID=1450535 RepID=A0A317UX57_9EURO|nr:hypothetical protein BO94DRAFT_332861 [Aspergillus sclerotioniger CBS 115572]PWY66126.1 hypothetical protein BO94DRAFT_332861 [Aspergillus sclerotioniger CBS 115572]
MIPMTACALVVLSSCRLVVLSSCRLVVLSSCRLYLARATSPLLLLDNFFSTSSLIVSLGSQIIHFQFRRSTVNPLVSLIPTTTPPPKSSHLFGSILSSPPSVGFPDDTSSYRTASNYPTT